MSTLLIVVVLLVVVVVLSRSIWSSMWGERRSLNRHKRAMDVLGSLPGRQPWPRGETVSSGCHQVSSSDDQESRPDEALVGDSVEAPGAAEDVRGLDGSRAEVGRRSA